MSEQEWFTDYDREVSVAAWRVFRAMVIEWRVEVSAGVKPAADAINSAFFEIAQSDISPPLPVNIPPHSYHSLVSGEWHKQ